MQTGSYWLDHAPTTARRSRSAPGDDDVIRMQGIDVLVVGGGMAGVCTAMHLHERGASVALVEAGEIGGRTTGHTTAKITALHGAVYHTLRSGRDHDVAVAYASANRRAVTDLRSLIERHDIDCDLTEATAYTCASTAEGVVRVEAEAEAAGAAGLPVRLTTETDLPWEVDLAVALDGEAHFHPVRFVRGAVERLRAASVPVVEGVRVLRIDEDRHGCTVRLEGDRTLRVGRVVQTTHLPVTDPAFLAARVRPERSYVVAGPAPRVPAGMYLSTDQGWSVRPAPGRPATVLVGGEGHPMVEDVSSEERYERLFGFATDTLSVDVTHRWSAFDYAPVDGLPFIGRLTPRSHRRFVATGFHKWGMSFAMVSARILGDLLDGTPNDHADVFDATRVVRTIGVDIVRNNAEVAVRFVGDRLAAIEPAPDLRAGEGSVTLVGRHPVAISRDTSGTLRSVRATCPHMGCVVKFNDGDQTWDCPCHGSRFALDGSVLDGPATDPLEPADAPELA
jgi:glycine/D-amino acid oxidase-like deaminating enzyme/nitrite reductase/ring-hydroxylating ferredoxin subunit